MSACRDVNHWMTRNLVVPVEGFLSRQRQLCESYRRLCEQNLREPSERTFSEEQRRCEVQWWNPFSWICWLVVLVIRIVVWIVVTIITWVVYLVCQIVCEIVRIIVKLVLRVVRWLVTFVVCLFTDFVQAWVSFRELYTDVLSVIEDIFNLVKLILDDIIGILNEVERFVDSLASAFGVLGAFFFGVVRWVIHVVRDVVDIVREIVDGVQDLLFGGLRLNLCRFVAGVANIGIQIVRIVFVITRLVFGSVASIAESVQLHDLEPIILNALNQAFPSDRVRLERAKQKIGIGGRPMGLPIQIDPRRFFLKSTSTSIDLRNLHNTGVINLFTLAGYMSDCNGIIFTRVRGEVVYADSEVAVSFGDLEVFLAEGPAAVPEFWVFPTPRDVFARYLEFAKRKATTLGLELNWTFMREIEITNMNQIPLDSTEVNIDGEDRSPVHDAQFDVFGRVGRGDNLSVLPVIALFGYSDATLNGLTSWFRLPSFSMRLPPNPNLDANYTGKSGVSFKENLPFWGFRYVPIHEMGHYFGLDHAGHDTANLIMFSPRGAPFLSWPLAMQYILLSGESNFTPGDARIVWKWITEVGVDSLLP